MMLIHVHNKREQQQFEHSSGPIEFGRGARREDFARCVIQDDLYVSKDHLRIEEIDGGQVRLTNLSQRNPVWLSDNAAIPPGQQREAPLPVRLTIGETCISVELCHPDLVHASSLATIAKPVRPSKLRTVKPPGLHLEETPDPETLASWFETLIQVQRAAAGSNEFYEQTAQAVVDLVGLDRGLVLLRRGENWEPVARAGKPHFGGREFSLTILRHVTQERRTFYQSSPNAPVVSSLHGVEAVVASPILDARDEVVGVIYGSRTRPIDEKGLRIGPLEAQVMQMLASAVGAGLARLEQEAEAGRLRIQFEQFFSPSLAHELQRNPRLLEGQERVVTILFTDIRGFSLLSERLPAQEICQLVRDVMGEVTEQVRAHEGVVVDYAGDGMLAMWNAPTDQPNHAILACRAALTIDKNLPKLSEAWAARLGGPLQLGLGLNTGTALVGNTGSALKFKYAPLGHTVNLASRVEGATKQMGIPILITGSTRALLGDQFATRRLCKVRVVGISGALDLYELYAEEPTSPAWRSSRDAYENALAQYEAGQWAACCRGVYPLLAGHEGDYDIPSLNLVTRAIECLKSPPRTFDAVMEFNSK